MMLGVHELPATDSLRSSVCASTSTDTGTSDHINSRCSLRTAPSTKDSSCTAVVPVAVVPVAAAAAAAAAWQQFSHRCDS
eukprot:7621-Heterococcus_DN1.PRE.2